MGPVSVRAYREERVESTFCSTMSPSTAAGMSRAWYNLTREQFGHHEDGGDVLPGFRLQVEAIFEQPED